MPPASRRTCSFPGCKSGPIPEGESKSGPYVTHQECMTRAEVTEDLNSHVKMVHELPLQHKQVSVQQFQAETERLKLTPQNSVDDDISLDDDAPARPSRSKLETIPRPKISSNSTQSDWSFFVAQWARYVSGANLNSEQKLNQLWACCSLDLQRSLHDGNSASIKDPNVLMKNVRLLALKKLNNLVNIVDFQDMAELTEETVTAFATRLNGHANLCDMNKTCSNCDREVSFKKKMILYQFV